MEKTKIQKYTKIIGILTTTLIGINLINGLLVYKDIQNNEKINNYLIESLRNNKLNHNREEIKENIRNSEEAKYSLALVNMSISKIKLLYVDTNKSFEDSGMEDFLKSNDKILFTNTQLSNEAKEKYKEFESLSSRPITENEISEARKNLEIGRVLYKELSSNNSIPESFKILFKNNLNELDILTKDDNSIEIINIYRANLGNKEFQDLLVQQNTETLWSKYFKDKFGEKINSIAYLQDGSYYKKEGLE